MHAGPELPAQPAASVYHLHMGPGHSICQCKSVDQAWGFPLGPLMSEVC